MEKDPLGPEQEYGHEKMYHQLRLGRIAFAIVGVGSVALLLYEQRQHILGWTDWARNYLQTLF